MTKIDTDAIEDKKKQFEQALVNTFRRRMQEYAKFQGSELAAMASAEVSGMGNFTDPETGLQYGFKLTVGKVDFFEDAEEQEDEEECEDD